MNFRGVLSRDGANLLIALNSQLKEKGITVDLKIIASMEILLQVARVFDDQALNDLANRLEIECQLTSSTSVTLPVGNKDERAVSISDPVPARKTKTIIYRGQKVEVEV